MTDEFGEASKAFGAKCAQLKQDARAKVQHKPPIPDAALKKKLYKSRVFSTSNPKTLLNNAFLETMLYFCRRGRQNLRQLKMFDFVVGTDSAGAKFVSKVIDELTKNHRENDEGEDVGTRYASGDPFCPVSCRCIF